MKETSLTIEQIETTLAGHVESPFYYRRNIVVPNCDWGFLNHEADLLVASKSHYLTEIEIKRTWSDFKADFEKKHFHNDIKLSHFYYAVPLSIAEKAFCYLYEGKFLCRMKEGYKSDVSQVIAYKEANKNKCGLIIYASTEELDQYSIGRPECCINVPAKRMGNYRLTEYEEMQLLRLLGMRIWNLKKKLSKYQKI